MKNKTGRIHRLSLLLGLVLTLAACKKDSSSSEPEIGEPAKTEKGETKGTAVQKVIGPGGGTITSEDGSLTVNVPAGAVSSNTTFGIQPITNTLYEDTSTTAFRLTPEGITFNTPLEVSLNYGEGTSRSSNPEWIIASYQTAEGNWKAVPGKVNKDTKKFTFKTTHFSDWSITNALSMSCDRYVDYGDTALFVLRGYTVSESDLLAPLKPVVKNLEWRLIHPTKGKLMPDKDYIQNARFTPFNLPPNTSNIAEVSAKFNGKDLIKVPDETQPDGYARFDQVEVLGQIEIRGNSYMTGVFKGEQINIPNVIAIGENGSMAISAQQGSTMFNLNAFAVGVGRYYCGEAFAYGKSQAMVNEYTGQVPKTYASFYEYCSNPRTIKYSSGFLEITKWGKVSEEVKGYFSGTVYVQTGSGTDGCPIYQTHVLYVNFKTIRTM